MQHNTIKTIYNNPDKPMSIAVFLSGTGTNFDAIYNEQVKRESSGTINYARIDAVFTNVPDCKGAKKAERRGIPVVSLSSGGYYRYINTDPGDEKFRKYYDAAVLSLLERVCDPDLIVLAGYRRKLSSLVHEKFNNRIINMYPGDITKDYLVTGTPAYIQALNAGEKKLKCSVYLERNDTRFGSLIAQSRPLALTKLEQLERATAEKIIREEAEWPLFTFAIHELIANGRVSVDTDNRVYIDGVKTCDSGFQP